MGKMKKDIQAILTTCKNFSRILDELEQDILHWIDRKEKLSNKFIRQIDRHTDLIQDLPENWVPSVTAQYMAGKFFMSPAHIQKYLRSVREDLIEKEISFFKWFLKHPWEYAIFEVQEAFDKSLLSIRTGDERKILLRSPGIADLYREGKNTFFALLFDNGECYQTYGLFYSIDSFTFEDFRYFAWQTNPNIYRSLGMEAVIAKDPVPFLLMHRFSETPAVFHGENRVMFCFTSARIESFSPESVPASIQAENAGDVTRYEVINRKPMFDYTDLFYEAKKRIVTLSASSNENYREARNLLPGADSLPEDPEWNLSMNLVLAVEKILGKTIQPVELGKLFSSENSDPEEEKVLAVINAFMQELADLHNTGERYSIKDLAEKHGITEDEAKRFENHFIESFAQFEIDIDGGFPGFTQPPPAEKRKFKGRLTKNRLFKIVMNEESRTIFEDRLEQLKYMLLQIKKKSVAFEEFPELIESCYIDLWENRDQTFLLFTLYLLKLFGDEFQPVRDYAVESLKAFWMLAINDKEDDMEIENFISFYSTFCFSILEPPGLIETEGKLSVELVQNADYRIRTGPLFDAMLTWK